MKDSPFRYDQLREEMVNTQLLPRGIENKKVLNAMRTIPRHLFVPENLRSHAYEDKPLGIGQQQTISQPYMVALMTQLLAIPPDATVLEIGTGSGYQAAVLASLFKQVITLERHPALAEQARTTLNTLGYTNIAIHVGDGSLGAIHDTPFDGIMITAGSPAIPKTLKQQLKIRGKLVCPVGTREKQQLFLLTRHKEHWETQKHSACRFVPLIGEEGWGE